MFFEDFTKDFEIETGSRKISKKEILDFAHEWDPQSFHIDEVAAQQSPYGGIIASGWQTLLIAFKLILDTKLFTESSIGSPGMSYVKWILPVRPDDSLQVFGKVVSYKKSKSKPDRGFVNIAYSVIRNKDELVCSYEATHLLWCKNNSRMKND